MFGELDGQNRAASVVGMRHHLFASFLLLTGLGAGHGLWGILPMRDQWRLATTALASGQAAKAAAAFEAFAIWYGEETAAMEPDFKESFLRLYALAAIGAGQHPKALQLIEAWLPNQKKGDPFHSYLLFQKVRLHLSLAEPEAAEAAAQQFLRDYSDLPERCLIRWHIAEAAFMRHDRAHARKQWEAILGDTALPQIGRELARGALALLELHEARPLEAWNALEGTVAGEAFTAWRCILAPTLATQLMEAGYPEQALAATDWLDPTAPGIPRSNGISPLTTAAKGVREAIWHTHWQQETQQVKMLLTAQSPELTRDYSLRLSALRRSGQYAAARRLAEALIASRDILPADLLAIAHREGVEALLATEHWQTAEIWIREFIKTSPGDPAIPGMRLMAARALAGQGDWMAAIASVEGLLGEWPTHKHTPTWAFLRGVWLLRAQQGEAALQQFEALAATAPASWAPLINLQLGKCLHATGQREAAILCLSNLFKNHDASASIRESAALEWLKLLLPAADRSFEAALRQYRSAFPNGQLAALVDNLEGTHLLSIGDWENAHRVWSRVATQQIREAVFARQQLLADLPRHQKWEVLREQAVQWLLVDWEGTRVGSLEGFQGAALYQQQTGAAALPSTLMLSLFEGLDCPGRIPPLLFFDILAGAWPQYRDALPTPSPDFTAWLEALVSPSDKGRLGSIAKLYLAEQLERQGRPDSADALRIAVLQEAPTAPWEAGPAYLLAKTADQYDFPDAATRLNTFIVQFKTDRRYPDSLFLMAGRLIRQGQPESAIALLEEIGSEWPDSPLVAKSALQLADLHLQARRPGKAIALLDGLLARPQQEPAIVAQALERRLHGDLLLNQLDRALLTGLRLLTLYPTFNELCDSASQRLTKATTDQPLPPETAALWQAFEDLLRSPCPAPAS